MSYTISIEGSAESAPAEPGDTVLDAMLMAGIGFAYSCQAGNCGTCKCALVDGEILELEYSEHALSPAERARGIVLACRSQVWSDVTVRKLDAEEFVVHPSRVMQCRVAALDRLTHDVWCLRLEILAGGPFTFSAGQYAALEFPFAPGHPRDYSMASRPDDPVLEFHIREVASSVVSAGLGARLSVGDTVRVTGPFGTSYLRERHTGPVIAVAGGTGLAPVCSILATLRSRGGGNDVHLYFGARAERDVYAEMEMRSWVDGFPGSAMHVVLSEPDPRGPPAADTARRSGLVSDAIDADWTDLAGFVAYVAGPPAMVEAAIAVLQRKGLARHDIHADAFFPARDSGRAAA
jgi:CDP-4-dehydro-6-deoxyglucose reductase/ferredoxin-NAD(P)+ reductase (naphthalene dioxygenase ferredoxin-specific)